MVVKKKTVAAKKPAVKKAVVKTVVAKPVVKKPIVIQKSTNPKFVAFKALLLKMRDQIVGDIRVVAPPNELDGRVALGRTALLQHGVECELRPLPALVAVHRVVTARDRRDPVVG